MFLSGIPAAPGFTQGRIKWLKFESPAYSVPAAVNPVQEIDRFCSARDIIRADITGLLQQLAPEQAEYEPFLEMQLLFLDDPQMLSKVELLLEQGQPAESAVTQALTELQASLAGLSGEQHASKTSDLEDIKQKLLKQLSGRQELELTEPVIITGKEILPSVLLKAPKGKILGIICAQGGINSHTAILARSMGYPAVFGVENLESLKDGDWVALDADRGVITLGAAPKVESPGVQPVAETAGYQLPKDIAICANISSLEDAALGRRNRAQGVGLVRTEMFFLDSPGWPALEAQKEVYRNILAYFQPEQVSFRLFDFGLDKSLPNLPAADQASDSFGVRGIRLLLQNPEVILAQVKALSLAAQGEPVRIMIPMLSSLEELTRLEELLFTHGGFPAHSLKLGAMLEVPSALFLLPELESRLQFFSIGSNDLTQYLLAADRNSPLGNSMHPALLRALHWAATRTRIELSLCGEMAQDRNAMPVLRGLGLKRLSVNPIAIPKVCGILGLFTPEQAAELTREILGYATLERIQNRIAQFYASL